LKTKNLSVSVSSPEKAGVGGSIPSLATTESTTYQPPETQFCSILFQKLGSPKFVSPLFGTPPPVLHSQVSRSEPFLRSPADCESHLLTDRSSSHLRDLQDVVNGRLLHANIRAAIYLRCSTAGKRKYGSVPAPLQNPEVQLQPLLQLVEQRGWGVYQVYCDRMSGDKQARPGLEALMEDAHRGRFRVVVVWRFDRFARSVKQLVLALDEFRSLGIDFVSHQEALDTGTPMGKAMFTIIGAMAELEHSVIRERTLAGMEYARRYGTKSGRRIGRPRRIFDQERVVELKAKGWSLRQIARELEVGVGTVSRALEAARRGADSRGETDESSDDPAC